MSKSAQKTERSFQEDLHAAFSDFKAFARLSAEQAIGDRGISHEELARRLGWSETKLSSALRGGFSFKSWSEICLVLHRDPVETLAAGQRLHQEALERERLDEMDRRRQKIALGSMEEILAFWKRLPGEERYDFFRQLLAEPWESST